MPVKDVLKWKLQGKRSLERLKQRWMIKILKDLTILGMDNFEEVTLDREKWKDICNTVIGLNGV